jgi:hypothetical protein
LRYNFGEVEEAIRRGRAAAHALAELLAGRPHDESLVASAPPTLAADFCRLNAADVAARLRERVADALPAELVERAFAEVRNWPVEETLARLQHGFAPTELAEALHRSYARTLAVRPDRAELAALENLLRAVDHRPLRLLHALWTGQRDALRRELAALPDEDYCAFVGKALDAGLAAPEDLLVPGRSAALAEVCRPRLHHDPGGLIRLAEALLRAGEAAVLEGLTEALEGQPEKTLRTLQALAERHPDTPAAFREAVEAALAAHPPPKSLVRRLLDRVKGET